MARVVRKVGLERLLAHLRPTADGFANAVEVVLLPFSRSF